MKLTFEKQQELAESISEDYERFEAERRIVRARLVKKLEEQIQAEMQEQFALLAKKLHEAHATGLPKATIRKAVKKAGNPTGFDEIWFAIPVDNEVDLRRGVKAVPEQKKWVWVEDDLVVTLEDGTEHTLLSVALEDEEFTVFSNSDDYYGTPEYTELILAAQEALRERSNA